MQIFNALDAINHLRPNQIETMADSLPLELIEEVYALTDTVTLRKRIIHIGIT
mgnify:CR=1 FL=1